MQIPDIENRLIVPAFLGLVLIYVIGGPILADLLLSEFQKSDSKQKCAKTPKVVHTSCGCSSEIIGINRRYMPVYNFLNAPRKVMKSDSMVCKCGRYENRLKYKKGACRVEHLSRDEIQP